MDSFVMVRPTGQPLNAAVGQWVKTEMAEAAFHWRRYFRGEPRVKDDSAITDADIWDSNLVLWGDPSSNKLLARIVGQGLDPAGYGWYLDLRKYGTFVHSGFGLGLERTVSWICGIPHIREAIAFPRQIHRLYP